MPPRLAEAVMAAALVGRPKGRVGWMKVSDVSREKGSSSAGFGCGASQHRMLSRTQLEDEPGAVADAL